MNEEIICILISLKIFAIPYNSFKFRDIFGNFLYCFIITESALKTSQHFLKSHEPWNIWEFHEKFLISFKFLETRLIHLKYLKI